MKIGLLFSTLFLLPLFLIAQSEQEKLNEYKEMNEQYVRSQIMRVLDSGVQYLEKGEYELADEKFRYVLNNIKSVPSDLVFFFGKNSFYLKDYKQSVDWLNKYIQLKGTGGQYSLEAADILEEAQAGILLEKMNTIKNSDQILSRNYEIDCGPSGKITCPVCKGNHVIIKKGPFGDEYKTCSYCDDHGILTCEEYNQLLRGELAPKR
jgi:tetratricopeptide (TPR) repeat protein